MSALTPAQARFIDRVDRPTRQQIAPRAARYDEAGQNPVESWRTLAREALLGAAVPAAHGGLGLDMAPYIAAIRTIARGCASTAMTVHMHSSYTPRKRCWMLGSRRRSSGVPSNWIRP
jgi:alkylation response protein AidB-like acyl-CoA dehydrogenase